MKIVIKTFLGAILIAGTLGAVPDSTSAAPAFGGNVAAQQTQEGAAPNVENVYYRCGYYGCRRRYTYRRYRYYGNSYYGSPYYNRGYYYRPGIGVGIGGLGVRVF